MANRQSPLNAKYLQMFCVVTCPLVYHCKKIASRIYCQFSLTARKQCGFHWCASNSFLFLDQFTFNILRYALISVTWAAEAFGASMTSKQQRVCRQVLMSSKDKTVLSQRLTAVVLSPRHRVLCMNWSSQPVWPLMEKIMFVYLFISCLEYWSRQCTRTDVTQG